MNRVREIVKASYAHGAHIYGAGSCIIRSPVKTADLRLL